MKFLVPPEMAPGVYRQGVGLFGPGSVLELPDAASKPGDVISARLVPLDEEAAAALKKAHGAKAKPLPADVQAAVAAATPKQDDGKPQTMKEAAKRASDSK
jgi:hypothetical protein